MDDDANEIEVEVRVLWSRIVLCAVIVSAGACHRAGQNDPGGSTKAAPDSTPSAAGPTPSPAPGATPSAAPGAAPAAPVATAGFEACSLVSKPEIEAAVGHAVMEPSQKSAEGGSSCAYDDPRRPTEAMVFISIIVSSSAADAKTMLEMVRSDTAAVAVEPLEGSGDVGFWDARRRSLYLAKGGHLVGITVGPEAGGLAAARSVAAKALPKLP